MLKPDWMAWVWGFGFFNQNFLEFQLKTFRVLVVPIDLKFKQVLFINFVFKANKFKHIFSKEGILSTFKLAKF